MFILKSDNVYTEDDHVYTETLILRDIATLMQDRGTVVACDRGTSMECHVMNPPPVLFSVGQVEKSFYCVNGVP